MSGYTKAHRSRFKHPLFRPGPWCRGYAWDWMVSQAAWKPHQIDAGGKTITLDRGQFSHSIRFMAEVFGWSKGATERFISRLKTETMIGTDTGTGQLIITICNYDKYQAEEPEAGTPTETQTGTAAGQQRDKQEELKEIKELKEEENTPPSVDDVSEAVNYWNRTAEQVGWPTVQKVTQARRSALKARLRDAGGIDGWRYAIDRAASSQFLTEKWGAKFDWLCKQANFTKLMEGNYDNRDSLGGPSDDPTLRAISAAARTF